LKKIILLLTIFFAMVFVNAQDNTTEINSTDTVQTVPSITATTSSTLMKVKDEILLHPGRYVIGLIIVLILVYFIYKALEKDEEKQIDKIYKKAANLHKIAEEYHKDGFPNLAEQTHNKAERYRQKAREIKATL